MLVPVLCVCAFFFLISNLNLCAKKPPKPDYLWFDQPDSNPLVTGMLEQKEKGILFKRKRDNRYERFYSLQSRVGNIYKKLS